jgi:hypothetical protein
MLEESLCPCTTYWYADVNVLIYFATEVIGYGQEFDA